MATKVIEETARALTRSDLVGRHVQLSSGLRMGDAGANAAMLDVIGEFVGERGFELRPKRSRGRK